MRRTAAIAGALLITAATLTGCTWGCDGRLDTNWIGDRSECLEVCPSTGYEVWWFSDEQVAMEKATYARYSRLAMLYGGVSEDDPAYLDAYELENRIFQEGGILGPDSGFREYQRKCRLDYPVGIDMQYQFNEELADYLNIYPTEFLDYLEDLNIEPDA